MRSLSERFFFLESSSRLWRTVILSHSFRRACSKQTPRAYMPLSAFATSSALASSSLSVSFKSARISFIFSKISDIFSTDLARAISPINLTTQPRGGLHAPAHKKKSPTLAPNSKQSPSNPLLPTIFRLKISSFSKSSNSSAVFCDTDASDEVLSFLAA